MDKEKKFSSVSLPSVLLDKIRKEIEGTGFTSVGSYVEYILREVLMSHRENGSKDINKDKERVRTKLKALGYI